MSLHHVSYIEGQMHHTPAGAGGKSSPIQNVLRRVSSSITFGAAGIMEELVMFELEMLSNGGHALSPHGTAYRRDTANATQA